MMKDFVKVIKNQDIKGKTEKFVLRKHLGTITLKDKKTEYDLSTNWNGTGLMITDSQGNIIGLDTEKFVDYIVDHFQEILNEDTKNKEES